MTSIKGQSGGSHMDESMYLIAVSLPRTEAIIDPAVKEKAQEITVIGSKPISDHWQAVQC